MSHGAAVGFASANRGNAPRTVALGDAINAATVPGRQLVIDDETLHMVPMMRDPRDRTGFGPSNPLDPAPIDPSRRDTGRPEPRLTEYPVSWNLPGSAAQPIPWATLRAAAENVDIMRRCISVRQEQLQGLDWSITLDDQLVQAQYAVSDGGTGREDIEAEMRRKLLPEIERLTAFWKNPWKANGVSFEQWCNGIMEDHLVLDAVAVYPRMTYGGDLSAFELIDPTTIRLLIDYRGARPEPPFPAFQQDLYGFPRAEFGSCYADDDGTPAEGIAASSLFYFREQYRSFTPYGFSAVQQALISARLYLRRQGWMLAEYEDGSTPLTFLVPDATDGTMVEKLNPKTRQQWEDSINAMYSGQTRQRHRMKVLQPGMQPVQMQGVDERYKPDYDMHLIKMLAGHFGVTSTGLGFSESKGLGNSGLHEGQADVQQAATTKPDKRMIERIVNELMQTYQGAPAELRFKFTDPDVEDQAAEDASANAQRARGTITLNDDRKRIGKSPYTFPEADMPMALLGTGWVPVEGMAARAEQAAEAEQALVEDQLANSEATREATAMEAEAEELSGETAEKALELAAYRRWARKRGGDARRPFICKALAPSDWPGQDVPRDVDFADWAWVPDGLADDADDEMIMKSFGGGNDNWRTLARDSRGRWVKRGSMRVDALGPSTPDKPVLAGLARDAERRRTASATTSHRGGTISPVAASYGSAGGFRAVAADGKDLGTRADEHTARRALDAYAAGKPQPGAKPARETDAARMAASAGQAVDVTAGSSAADKLRRAELMYGTDRSKWPAKARQDAARLERQLPVSEESSTIGGMTPKTPPPVPSREERAAALNASAAAMMSGGPAPKGSMAERVMNRQDQSVRDVVTSLQDAPGGIVAMADVRRKLRDEHGMDRGQQDAAIRRLVTTGDRSLNTFPEDNQKTITDADRAAAIDLGAGPQHIISLDPPRTAAPSEREQRIAAALAEIPEVRQTTRGRGKQAREAFSAAGFLHDTREAAEAARRAEAERLVDREDKAAELDRAAIEAEGRNDAEGAALARADRAQMRYEDAQARTDHLGDLAETLDTDEARARHDVAIAESERLRAEADEAELAYNAAQRPRLRAEQDAANQRAGEGLERINAERAERERKAAEDAAAEVERKAREREENARRVAEIKAAERAELARRTPEAFALMLDGGDKATTHAPSRKILADMREQGWTMTHMNGSMMRFEAPDGRGIRMTYGKDRVKWERGDYKGNQTMGESISLPAAAALVADKPRSTSADDPELTTVREATPTAGYALPTTPPAARAEAIAASTPDAPSAAPRDPAELTGRAYRSLLATVGEGGRITHPQSRKIVETMERGGWKLADVKPGMSSWAHEDGRRITMLSGADKPTFMADGRKLTGKAALEHVESDHRVTQAAMERVRSVKGLDAQMDAVDAELERPGLREHTRRELEVLQAKGEAIREAARGPQETPEARMERVKAEVAQQRAAQQATAQREIDRAVEYVGDVMPKTRGDGAALATRLGLKMFNVQTRPDGTFTFALSAPGQSGSARLATFDSARGGWTLPGLGGYTFDANDPEFMATWLHEGTKASHLNDNTKRAHKVSELLREARR